MSDVHMPQLGESVTEGTLGKWLKNVGDTVEKYEPLVEVITDKVNAEIPSDYEGVLTEIFVQEGDTVQVGTVVCRISDGNVGAEGVSATSTHDVIPAETYATGGTPAATTTVAAAVAGEGTGRGRFSPAVLKLSQEHNIDLAQLTGTGEGGRITRKDVLAFVDVRSSGVLDIPSTSAPSTPPPVAPAQLQRSPGAGAAPSGPSATADADTQVIEPTAVRKTIARRMVESKHTAPHAWTMVEADVTELAKFRTGAKSEFKQREGIDLTYLPFFIKSVVEALKQYPIVNSAWIDDKIHVKNRIHISIAVATDDALVVPVIHDADRLSISGIAHAVQDLVSKARTGRLTLNDVQGGTFTVNNTGAFGSILSQPIINAPQAAILSLESIVKRPVVVQDAIAIRNMVNLCLSLDHRVLDGWVAGQFLKAIKERLQAYGKDTIIY